MKQSFVIDYGLYFTDNRYESHQIIVKNCDNEFHAKIKLEDYLKKKHPLFQRLVVHKCMMDFMGIFQSFHKNEGFNSVFSNKK